MEPNHSKISCWPLYMTQKLFCSSSQCSLLTWVTLASRPNRSRISFICDSCSLMWARTTKSSTALTYQIKNVYLLRLPRRFIPVARPPIFFSAFLALADALSGGALALPSIHKMPCADFAISKVFCSAPGANFPGGFLGEGNFHFLNPSILFSTALTWSIGRTLSTGCIGRLGGL